MDAVSLVPVESMKWYEVWREAVLHPSTNTFGRILADPAATPRRAYAWVGITSTLIAILELIFNPNPTNTSLLLCTIFGPLFNIISLALGAQILHGVAKRYHGQGSYNRMVHVFGAISAPFSIIYWGLNTLLSSFEPLASIIVFFIGIYVVSLEVRAIKAAEGITTSQAIWTLILPGLVLAAVAVVVIVVLALLGPALGAGAAKLL